ncbi:protein PAT1 homolog 1-like [Anopheles maculipalpis]|uniref:protein PAT1 homolog 1-like n=1 Tax=Anopheles maculipalpis TaxID=1496333 RepID=UPI0021599365|nr:protein PAT1 homolog 1-like [Anopheles maculipalpis]
MDSFFGFNTKLPDEHDAGEEEEEEEFGRRFCPQTRTRTLHSPRRSKEDISDEEEYDALNDETFGSADKGDWEDIHENLVRLERNRNASFPGDDDDVSSGDLLFEDYDFDLQLSKLTQYDTNDESGRSSVVAQSIGDEFASKLRLDPSIWGSPLKVQPSSPQQPQQYYDRKSNVTPFAQPNAFHQQQTPARPAGLFPPMKMLSVEDIERSIIQNQHQQNQHQQSLQLLQKQIAQQQQQQQTFRQSTAHHHQPVVKPREHYTLPPKEAKTIQSLSLLSSLGVPTPALMTPPPHLLAARNCALFPPGPPPPSQPPPPPPIAPPLLNHPNRLPLGLLPYNILQARPYSTPINNLAMHPAFPPRCPPYGSPLQGFMQGPPPPVTIGPPIPQRHPGPPGPFLMQRSPTPLQNNQFNQRLVQEIQQNHPLLAFNRQLANSFNAPGNGMKMNVPQNLPRSAVKQLHYAQQQQQQQQRLRHGNGIPGGLAREHDEYANMMSNRDKQWLIGIQLTQLNSDLPYWNDYYFTVFKQRLAAGKGNGGENRIYKENQLSHPFTQTTPTSKEHAHLLLLSMLTRNVKGGGGGAGMMNLHRERRSSESKSAYGNDGKDGCSTARSYTPFQFEKSLGKLQCGSVIAPRKLIDADVMGSDQLNGNGAGTAAEQSLSQRKARHVLLLIEALYKLLLKLEDKLNPIAIATANLLREKKLRESNGGCPGQLNNIKETGATNGMLDTDESFDDLSAALIGQLSQEKITSILGVRKGRILIRRSLAVLQDHPSRWTLWGMIFTALPCLAKKDRDDAEGLLLALFSEFERQLRSGTMEDLLSVAKTIGASRKVMLCIVSSKFLLSCIITIIFQMELFCGKNPASLQTTAEDDHWWITFLVDVNQVVKDNIIGPSTGGSISINPDNNIVRTLRVHFARFGTRVDGTDLLNFITDNGNGQQRLGPIGRKQSLQETNITAK